MKLSIDQPIGVFDSGMGGLTVLRALTQALPNEQFVYLGDTARLPYGSKSGSTVTRYALQAASLLVQQQIKLLVVACNTASAVALEPLRQQFAERGPESQPLPVIGVVQPGAVAACAQPAKHVWVLATESTVEGGAYAREILAQDSNKRVFSRACPLLVALAEAGRTDGPLVELALQEYLAGSGLTSPATSAASTLLLGCTHFPVFRKTLQKLVGEQTQLLDSAATTAKVVQEFLATNGLLRAAAPAVNPQPATAVQFLATDGVQRFRRVGEAFLGAPIAQVELVDL